MIKSIQVVAKDKTKPLSRTNCEIIADGKTIDGAKAITVDDYGMGVKFVTVTFLTNEEMPMDQAITLEQLKGAA